MPQITNNKLLAVKTYASDITDKFKSHNNNLKVEMNKADKYIKYQAITLSNNYNELLTGNYSRGKLIWLIAVRISMVGAFCLGFISANVNHPVVSELTLNVVNYFGDKFLVGTMLGIVMLSGIIFEYICTYHKRTGILHFAKLMYYIKFNLVKYPLSDYQRQIISYKLSVLIYFNKQLLATVLCVDCLAAFSIAVFELYREFNLFKLVISIMFQVGVLLCAIEMSAILCFGNIMVYLINAYLKAKFLEIHNKIHLSIVWCNPRQLSRAIVEHNYYEVWVRHVNVIQRIIVFIMYYIYSIGVELCIYSVHKDNTTLFGRILMGLAIVFIYCVIFSLSFVLLWIPKSAHKPYGLLLSYMSKTPVLSLRERLNVMAFIERLSPTAPPIGYYCYDLFPFNSYEFYQFIRISASNYLLLMNLF